MPNERTRPIADALKAAWADTGQPEAEQPFVGPISRCRSLRKATPRRGGSPNGSGPGSRGRSTGWSTGWAVSRFRYPAIFAGAEAMGLAFAGSPETARHWVGQAQEEAGIDYMAVELVFGELTTEEATREHRAVRR